MRPSKLQPEHYEYGLQVFEAISNPVSLHIMRMLEQQRNLTSAEISDDNYKIALVQKYLRRLIAIKLVRIDKLGTVTTYILDNDRLSAINTSASDLLPKNPSNRR